MGICKHRDVSDDSPLLIFVHGILSSGEKCWEVDGRPSWPDIVGTDSTLTDWSIFVVSYHTAVNSGKYSISDAAIALWGELEHERAFNGRPLLFICHSMGGIVVRKMLMQHQGDISRHSTIGLLLVASPTNGSWWARALSIVPKLLGHSQALALRPAGSNEGLHELNIDFRYAVGRQHLRIVGAEILEHWLIWIGKYVPCFRPVVYRQEGSGVFSSRPVTIPETTHFSITAPESALALQHIQLLGVVKMVTDAMYTLQLSVPVGARWKDLEGLLVRMLRMPVDFTLFTKKEMDAPLTAMHQVKGVSPKALAMDARSAAGNHVIRAYEVDQNGGVLRFRPLEVLSK